MISVDNYVRIWYTMAKYITVPTQYAIYEVPDEAFELLGTGMKMTPPQIVLEVLVMQGAAKRMGTVGTLTMDINSIEQEFDEDNDEPEEGEGPWLAGE